MGAGLRIAAKAGAAKTAEVYLYEDIGDGWYGGVSAKAFSDTLRGLGDLNQIDVRINSFGGDVFAGLAIYRLLVDHKANVTTYVDGIAASIASVIAMAGNQIEISESAQMMIHNAWTITIGDDFAHEEQAARLAMTSSALADIYAQRSGTDIEKVRKWMKDETSFTSAEAIDAGFADKVMPNLRMAAAVRPQQSKTRWSGKLRDQTPILAMPERPRFDQAKHLAERMRARLVLSTPATARA